MISIRRSRPQRQPRRGHGPTAAGREILRAPRRAALAGISILVGAASLVSFAESYRGLYLWSSHHGLHALWAAVWPLQIDVFIAVGELALFVALADSAVPVPADSAGHRPEEAPTPHHK
jgi:hypothetical protein